MTMSLIDVLLRRAAETPDAPAYHFLAENLEVAESLSYQQLDDRAAQWAATLRQAASGDERQHVLLAFEPGLEFITAFFGCLYAGLIAVPTYPPTRRTLERFQRIASTCGPAVVAYDGEHVEAWRRLGREEALGELRRAEPPSGSSRLRPAPGDTPAHSAAFLQFTSGSTSAPKGVVITHSNLMANQQAIATLFGHGPDSRILGWLPMQHDMGLIGIVMQPLYAGAPCWIMSPAHFARQPLSWLRAISRYGITTSGGPDFAYALCARKAAEAVGEALDLSSWTVAFNGAEPVRAQTLASFERAYGPSGFSRSAWLPCYGLAEATLLVAGERAAAAGGPTTLSIDTGRLQMDGRIIADPMGSSLVACGPVVEGLQLAVVDPVTALPCPDATQGEIWLAGPSVAAGYHGDDLDGRFSGRMDDGSGPYLRTGDLGAQVDGRLYVTGRLSDLIIVRGRNLHPQDIEWTAQQAVDGVAGAAAFEDGADGDTGVGLVVEPLPAARHQWETLASRAAGAVAAAHGVRVLRVAAVRPGLLPRTTSGKVRRRQTRLLLDEGRLDLLGILDGARHLPANQARPSAPRAMPLEAWVARAAGVPESSLDATRTLASLGLDSLATLQLQEEIRVATGTLLPFDWLAEAATLGDIRDRLGGSALPAQGAVPAVVSGASASPPPLSVHQRRLFMLDRLRGGEDAASLNVTAMLKMTGPLDVALLERSLRAVVQRHDVLHWTVSGDGELRAIALPARLPVERLGPSPDAADPKRAFFGRGFELSAGPLYHFALLGGEQADEAELLLSFHHIVMDGWSMKVFVRDLMTCYQAGHDFTVPPWPRALSYGDFARWQSTHDASRERDELRDALQGAPDSLVLPAEVGGSDAEASAGACQVSVEAGLAASLRARAREANSSVAAAWLTAFGVLLARLSGQEDLVVGTPAITRDLPGALQSVGLYLNLVPVRLRLVADDTLDAHLRRTRDALVAARRWRNVPFDEQLAALGIPASGQRTPLFQVFFNHLPDAGLRGHAAGLDYVLEPVLDVGSKFDLTLYVVEDGESTSLRFAYDTRRFQARRVEVLAAQLLHLARALCEQPSLAAGALPLREAAGSEHVRVEPRPWLGSVDERLRRWGQDADVATRPAIEWESGALTYAALDRLSNGLAAELRRRGVGIGSRVAVVAERCASLPWAMLSVLRAGGVFTVIDASYPPARIAEVRSVLEATLVIVCGDGAAQADGPALRLPASPSDPAALRYELERFDANRKSAEQPACITFTSGSSGRPEGVIGSHAGLVAFLPWQGETFGIDRHDRISMLSGLSHDPLQRDVFTSIWFGATLVVPPKEIRDRASAIVPWLAAARVSLSNLTPSLLRVACAEGTGEQPLPALRRIFLVGEAVHAGDIEQIRARAPEAEVICLYGATETQRALTHLRLPPGCPWTAPVLGIVPPGMDVVVLRQGGEAADVGELGEIAFRSPHLALGYLDPASPRAAAFEQDESAARRYRTGDRGWRTTAGEIVLAGRADRQVKVSGHRIELAEIEHAAMRELPLAGARAHWWADSEQLVLYFLVRPHLPMEAGHVLGKLAACLPRHMVPQAAMALPDWPLTANGKFDDRRLPRPDGKVGGIPPATPVELSLAELWSTLLGRSDISREDSFVSLGGHSLKALQLQALIERRFGVSVRLAKLLDAPTLSAMATELMSAPPVEGASAGPRATPQAAHDPFPLNDIQRAYLVGRRMAMGEGAVGSQSYYEFESAGIDLERLQSVWNRLVAHHPMLRAVVMDDGRQCVQPSVPEYCIAVHDWTAMPPEQARALANELRTAMTAEALDPARWPLFQIEASRWPGGLTHLHFRFDFIVADAWSWNILLADLSRCYEDPQAQLQAPSLSFRDYILFEQECRGNSAHARAVAFWRDRMADMAAAPQLPQCCSVSQLERVRFERRSRTVPAECWQTFKRHAQARGCTPTAALVGIFGKVLARWSKSPRFTLNLTLFDRRPVHPDVHRIVGDFTSVLLLGLDYGSPGTAAEDLRRVQSELWNCLDHREMSGVQVMREMNVRHAEAGSLMTMPIVFTSKLGLRDGENAAAMPAWLGRPVDGVSMTPQVWLDSQAAEDERGTLVLNWDAIDGLFEAGVLDAMIDAQCRAVITLSEDAELWDRPWFVSIPEQDLALQEAANATHQPLPAGLLHSSMLEQAAAAPQRPAVRDAAGRMLTHGELHHAAAQLALELRRRQVHGQPVGILMPKRIEQVVAALACHLSGNAYLPIDPGQGELRIRQIVRRARCGVVLVAPGAPEAALAEAVGGLLSFAVELPRPGAQHVTEVPSAEGDASRPAYVIFTSGSTGEPKGVVTSHYGAHNTCLDVNRRYGIGSRDSVLGLSALNFDLSVYDIFGVLGAGGSLVLPDADKLRDPVHWLELMDAHGITVWNTVPALMQMLVQSCEDRRRPLPPSLRLVLMSGDWVPPSLPRRMRALGCAARIVAMGGATEASIWSILHEVQDRDYAPSIPYGRAMANQQVWVLDGQLQPRPAHAVGEIYIGGIGLANGYCNDEEKTRHAFVHDPVTGRRLYRTGDLGRWRPDGEIEFLGREDAQVKIQGHRVELGEIEAALDALPEVERSVVVATGEAGGVRRLVGYVVLRGGTLDAEALRSALARRLPGYMVPPTLMALPALPLTGNGKVDRKRLPAPENVPQAAPRTPGLTALQQVVLSIYAEVLKGGPVVPESSFFEMGGTSLEVVQVQGAIRERLSLDVPVADLFRYGTAITLGDHLATLVRQRGLDSSPAASDTPPVDARRRVGDQRRGLRQRDRADAGA